jgi:hypothetical protein
MLGVSAASQAQDPFVVFPNFLRSQHLGIIGPTGSGKTHLIEHMIRQDIQAKTGFAVFDVHGDLADSVVAYLAERAIVDPDIYDRSIILEPFNRERSFGFNPLERSSGTSAFVQAQEFAYILRKRWQENVLSPAPKNCFATACIRSLQTTKPCSSFRICHERRDPDRTRRQAAAGRGEELLD